MTSEKTFMTAPTAAQGDNPASRGRRRRVVWTPSTGPDSLDLATEVRERSQRANIPLTKRFVRNDNPDTVPMLYRLYAGGRSGAVAIKLYVALVWRCSAPPYKSRRDPARSWATLLDLEDPAGNGSLRVRAALRKLEKVNLIRLDPDPGYPQTITLLAESGDGSPYEPASTRSFLLNRGRAAPSVDAYYFQIPTAMWVRGYMQELSGPALVMYLALACEQAYRRDQWFSTEQFPSRFRFSAQTRSAGTKELRRAQLLRVTSVALDDAGRSVSFNRTRRRNKYRLIGAAVPEEE